MKQGNVAIRPQLENFHDNSVASESAAAAESRNEQGWALQDSSDETEKTGVRSVQRRVQSRRAAQPAHGSRKKAQPGPTSKDENSSLESYFHGLAGRPLLDAAGERQASLAIEDAEIEHWSALLSYPPAGLLVIGRALARSEREPSESGSFPDADALNAIARRPASGAAGLTGSDRAEWDTACVEFAQRLRVWDRDRVYLAEANDFITMLSQQPNLNAGAPREEAADWHGYMARVAAADRSRLRAVDHFVESNLRLVIGVARRYAKGRMPLVDLIQEGNLGLITAVMRYDHRRGYRFATYAIWWIRHSICRALSNKGRTIRIPANLLRASARVHKASQQILTRTGEAAESEQITQLTGISKRELERVHSIRAGGEVLSLDRARDDDGDSDTFMDCLADEQSRAPEERAIGQLDTRSVARAFSVLTEMEASVLRSRFGLDDGEEQSLDQIGTRYNLSRERIRQIQVKALGKLRQEVAGCEDAWA